MDYEIYSYTEKPTEECIGILVHTCADAGEANAFFDSSEEIQCNGGCIVAIERSIIRCVSTRHNPFYDELALGQLVTILGG